MNLNHKYHVRDVNGALHATATTRRAAGNLRARGNCAGMATRGGPRREPEAPLSGPEPGGIAHEPAALAREPSADASPHPSEAPSPEASPAPGATLSTDSATGEATPVPRDNIPD